MWVEELGYHLSVSSIPELEKSLKLDKGFWNVISIRNPAFPRPEFLRLAKRVHEFLFQDLECLDNDEIQHPPRAEHVAAIFTFVDAYPGEPILVHCQAGISRSAAVALAIIVRGLVQSGASPDPASNIVEKAVGILLQIRPQARPNVLVLQLGLEHFLAENTARALALALAKHPILLKNRFKKEVA